MPCMLALRALSKVALDAVSYRRRGVEKQYWPEYIRHDLRPLDCYLANLSHVLARFKSIHHMVDTVVYGNCIRHSE